MEVDMIRNIVGAVLLVSCGTDLQAQPTPPPARPELYRFVMIQAAPGKLPELLDLYRQRVPVIVAGGDEQPIFIRHSQGDRWDLLAIFPSGSFTEYYSRERIAKREAAASAAGLSGAAFLTRMRPDAWHEDVFVDGPPLGCAGTEGQDAGTGDDADAGEARRLVTERQMEACSTSGAGAGMLIFTHEQGAAWDVITLDAWRDWRQYGELQMVPAEVSDAAAKKAGFASADAVGVYMRSLISTHHDSLGASVMLTR
jgi:hypothetical protein